MLHKKEKLIYSQVYQYFMKGNMLSEHQSGFRLDHSAAEIALHESLTSV